MPRNAVSRTAHVGTVGKNGLTRVPFPSRIQCLCFFILGSFDVFAKKNAGSEPSPDRVGEGGGVGWGRSSLHNAILRCFDFPKLE